MVPIEHRRNGLTISTDKSRLDIGLIHEYLSQDSYWATGRSILTVERSLANSICYGLYDGSRQVGFARVVTDSATFAWLCDVFLLDSHRGRGLGKWLVECVVQHPELRDLRIFLLATRDAHGLYERYGGFKPLEEPGRWMIRRVDQPRPAETRW
jgi:GNAT superfamily N-acetyltransferase